MASISSVAIIFFWNEKGSKALDFSIVRGDGTFTEITVAKVGENL